MKHHRYLVLIVVILVGVGLALAATRTLNKPTVKVVKVQIAKNLYLAGTGLKGTITVKGPLPTQMKNMTCSDVMVLIGTTTTPPPPAGGLGLSIPTFEEVTSRAATGNIASSTCTYEIRPVPAGVPYDILVNAAVSKFACNQVTLNAQPANQKITFQKDKMEVRDFEITPNCVIIK